MVIIYLINYFFYRIIEFLRHWYIKSFFLYFQFIVNIFLNLERKFGFKINLKHFFEPLYQDYTLIGFIFGLFFRSLRLFLTFIFYLVVFLFFLIIYIIWLIIPIYLLIRIFS